MSMTAHPHPVPTTRIVTLTMNPALDITTEADWVRHTDKIRCGPARHDPGGGGINVARVAAVLGASVSAVYPRGGLTGARIAQLLGPAVVLGGGAIRSSPRDRRPWLRHERPGFARRRFRAPRNTQSE